METKNTLFDAWVAGWKLHIFFYPIYFWICYDMMPKLFNPSNENPMLVKILATTCFILMGIMGLGRFAYLWYKNK
jgi:fatty acid desaturase